jgi:sn-glycerol 3-phosphate transport system permease protein
MTKGGPDSATMLLLYYIFETGFRFWDTAYAAALTVVLIAILSVVGIGQFFLRQTGALQMIGPKPHSTGS